MKSFIHVMLLVMASIVYLNLSATAKTDKVLFENISTVSIVESIKEPGTATLVVPRNYKKLDGKSILDYLKAGDPVTIMLGYDKGMYREFTGYIKTVNPGPPIELICEDATYRLRKTNYVKSYKSVTLKELLKDILTPLNIDFNAPDLQLGKFVIDNASAFTILEKLQTDYGMYGHWLPSPDPKGSLKLNVGFAYDYTGTNNHTYTIGKDVKDYGNLKFKRAEDFPLLIKAISNKPDGKKLVVNIPDKSPDNATVRTLNFGDMNEIELRKIAQSHIDKFNFDGYEGSITGFGIPRTRAGDSLTIKDAKEPDREGTYLIESVEIRFGNSYFERINTISAKV